MLAGVVVVIAITGAAVVAHRLVRIGALEELRQRARRDIAPGATLEPFPSRVSRARGVNVAQPP